MSQKLEFEVLVEKDTDSEACGIYFPFDTKEVFGTKARVPVRGTINGTEFRSSLAPMDGCHIMPVNTKLREAAGIKAGDMVKITMERDDAPRTVEVPADLAEALKNADLTEAFEKMSFTHRKEYVNAVIEAKKPETRLRRIEKTIEKLSTK
ncbi:MAG: YdeI/OmpD-associated family protein [Pyrinomonadaceae bacterium]|nr:YdeI/OmpD-associated family protein [Pyrinomonadaceae bacterium]